MVVCAADCSSAEACSSNDPMQLDFSDCFFIDIYAWLDKTVMMCEEPLVFPAVGGRVVVSGGTQLQAPTCEVQLEQDFGPQPWLHSTSAQMIFPQKKKHKGLLLL